MPRYSAPIHVRRVPEIVVAVVAFALVTGCGGGGEVFEPQTVSASDGDRKIPTTIQRAPTDAGETVIAIWGRLKAGDIPGVVTAYHPRVLELVGTEHLAEALATQQATVAAQTLRKAHISQTRVGQLVRLETTGPTRADYGYVVREEAGRWVILYDSLLITAIQGYVQGEVQARVNPRADTPSRRAVRAGAQAARRLRALFLPEARGRLQGLPRG